MSQGTAFQAAELKPECHLLEVDAALLAMMPSERPTSSDYTGPRLIKTQQYAERVQKEWLVEGYGGRSPDAGISSMGRPHVYQDSGKTNHGHVVYPNNVAETLPVICIFQTGAGPHDLYFRWKADIWARSQRCIIFIADLLGDDRGWGWDNDKSHYGAERKKLLEVDDSSRIRSQLRARLDTVMTTVKSLPNANPNSLAVFGFCLGGHVVVELCRMRIPGIKCITCFHGVFDGICDSAIVKDDASPFLEVQIHQGALDPYSTQEEMDYVANQLNMQSNLKWRLNSYEGVLHGYTNPAHIFHPMQNKFHYAEKATRQALEESLAMFARTCCT